MSDFKNNDVSVDSIREAFALQRQYVNHFFATLDMEQVKRFTDSVVNCEGTVFFTGMGKSGIIARNISQMFVSVGVRASYMSPVDALHGDVGILRPSVKETKHTATLQLSNSIAHLKKT
jgi:arabinose-5-phosphate isomerase